MRTKEDSKLSKKINTIPNRTKWNNKFVYSATNKAYLK